MANINDIPMKQYDTDGIKSFSNSQSDLAQLVYSYFTNRHELVCKYPNFNKKGCISDVSKLAGELLRANFANIVSNIYIALNGMAYYNDIRSDLRKLQSDIDDILNSIDILNANGIKGTSIDILRNTISNKIHDFVRKYRSTAGFVSMADDLTEDDEEDNDNGSK